MNNNVITSRCLAAWKILTFYTATLFTLSLLGCYPGQTGRVAQRVDSSGHLIHPESYYSGYSKKYLPYREKLAAGKIDQVLEVMNSEEEEIIGSAENEEEQLKEKLRLVGLMERASLALQSGAPDQALRYCRLGQEIIEKRESESYLHEGASAFGSLFVDFLGAGELARYDAPGYEKVMLLDLEAMAYLLKGDDRAYNVARLAVTWQEEEKEKFEKELNEVKEKEEEKVKTDVTETKRKSDRLTYALDTEFSKYDDMALSVPNAFVNPFGDYVTGMINEFKSVKIKSLLSNAHIAYKQALKLNPGSRILKQAVRDTNRKKNARRLIHVVAMDGFVPEKKVLSIWLDRDLDVELPTLNPISSQVKIIKVMTTKGRILATLSPVANLEALAMRHQKDSLPYTKAMLVSSAIRDSAMVVVGDSLFVGLGGLVRGFMDKKQEPDTTYWMTLPSTILAARIYAPKSLKTIVIRSYGTRGKKLARRTVRLGKGDRHFVLVRTIDKTMYAYPSEKIWTH